MNLHFQAHVPRYRWCPRRPWNARPASPNVPGAGDQRKDTWRTVVARYQPGRQTAHALAAAVPIPGRNCRCCDGDEERARQRRNTDQIRCQQKSPPVSPQAGLSNTSRSSTKLAKPDCGEVRRSSLVLGGQAARRWGERRSLLSGLKKTSNSRSEGRTCQR